MAETVQKNFRMSARAIKLLLEVARAQDVTETDVVEFCVAKYALELGRDVNRAKELLFQQICGAAASGSSGSTTGHGHRVAAQGESSALNEESRHGGPPALPHPDLEKAVHAAEGIVETARKRGSSKRK